MNDINDILEKAKNLEGKTISKALPDLIVNYPDNRRITKNVFAIYIEKDYFNLKLSSHSNPDFEDINLELKTTGIKFVKSKGIYNAKERLVLTQIDYKDVIKNELWTDNSHLKKINKILFIIYLYEKKPVKFENFQIVHTFKWEPTKEHSKLIQRDYAIIRKKIIKGQVISERDTNFLGNCPRHDGGYNKLNPSLSKSGAIAKHPNLNFAERRAFCIKQRAFDQIIADSLNINLKNVGVSIGLYKNDYPRFK
tara:strand:+ start:127 stop:882 length:756 start_codon:yes stop_codon:yes gene_type:complete